MKTAVGLVGISVIVAAFIGWLMNLTEVVKFIVMDPTSIGGLMIGRIVGIFFAPIGAILGYF